MHSSSVAPRVDSTFPHDSALDEKCESDNDTALGEIDALGADWSAPRLPREVRETVKPGPELKAVVGEALSADRDSVIPWAMLLRVDPATRANLLPRIKAMPSNSRALLGHVLQTADGVCLDDATSLLAIASMLLAGSGGTPEQRRSQFAVVGKVVA